MAEDFVRIPNALGLLLQARLMRINCSRLYNYAGLCVESALELGINKAVSTELGVLHGEQFERLKSGVRVI